MPSDALSLVTFPRVEAMRCSSGILAPVGLAGDAGVAIVPARTRARKKRRFTGSRAVLVETGEQ